jgi:hypothetical protein
MLPLAIALIAVAGLFGALPAQAISSVPANGRAWELVTFSKPASSQVFAMNPMGNSGEMLAYKTIGPPPGAVSGSFLGSGIARRGSTGWSNVPVGLPFSAFSTELFDLLVPVVAIAFSEDLQTSLWLTSVPVAPGGPPEGQLGLYRQVDGGDPQFIAQVGEGSTFEYPGFADISQDGSRVVFTTAEHLLPGDAGRTQGESVYQWDEAGLRLVDTKTNGALLSACGSEVSPANGMSASAQRVFFTHPGGECAETKRVYLHDLETGTTDEISASQCTRVDCNAPQDVTFVGATPDGSSAFLVSAQQLTNDDHDAGRDLYRYEVGSGQLVLLSGDSPEGEVDQAVVYPSDDGARVYFRASGVMVPGETASGEKLFLADEGGIHLVADASFPSEPQIQLSQSGEKALFVTSSKVVEADTDEQQDVYLYDATTELVTRISAGSSGGNGPFDANLTPQYTLPEFEHGNTHPFYAIDASGGRAFFSTAEPLVPEDVDSKLDVYEWTGGQLGLVTPAVGDTNSKFGGASRDGRTVIFGTSETLSPADEDGGDTDFYAARLGGGFPEPKQPSACGGASCSRPGRILLARRNPGSAKVPAKHLRRIRLLGIQSPDGGSAVGRKTLLLVSVPTPGLVSASVWVRQDGKKVLLSRGRKGAIKPGKVGVRLHLTAAGLGGAVPGVRKGYLNVTERGASAASRSVRISLGGGK